MRKFICLMLLLDILADHVGRRGMAAADMAEFMCQNKKLLLFGQILVDKNKPILIVFVGKAFLRFDKRLQTECLYQGGNIAVVADGMERITV